MPRLRRLAPLVLAVGSACVSGSDTSGATWEGCTSDVECKDGRVCRSGACAYADGNGGSGPEGDTARVIFRLAADPDLSGPIFVQDDSTSGSDAWFSLYRGDYRLPVAPTCMACFCGACDSCSLCGPGVPSVKELAPGDAVDLRWDGATFPVDSTCPGDGPCYAIRPVAEGDSYRAHFCWALSATGVGPGQELVPPLYCGDLVFRYTSNRAQLVAYEVTEGA
jgi:hypothetical protein